MKITICRNWNNPEIQINVSSENISLEMGLADFLHALADEAAEPIAASIAGAAGNPSFWFTKEVLTSNLIKSLESADVHAVLVRAANQVIEKVKQETRKIM